MVGKYFSLDSSNFPATSDGDILGEFDLQHYGVGGGNISYCPGGNAFILTHFGQCVSDPAQWASFVLGFISLCVWFFPSIPQIIENYKRGSCEGLSPMFLFLWFFGDTTNLVGAILTHQLPLQIYVGGYYIIQDSIILTQYVYYTIKNRRRRLLHDSIDNKNSDTPSTILNGLILSGVFVFSGNAFFLNRNNSAGYSNGNGNGDGNFRSRVLLAPIFNGASDEIGYVCGTVSAISYLGGRIPQLVKNHRRRSIEGVSLLMYALICLGNATYGAGILLGMDGDPWTYYARHMPWLAGSLLCLLLDAFVFVQYYRYRIGSSIGKQDEDTIPIISDQPQQQHENLDPSSSIA